MKWTRFSILLLGLILSASAHAKLFINSYVSFELPPNWDCVREGTEWVCVNQFSQKEAKEAIVVLTAKEVGPADTLAAYMAHLKEPRMLPSKAGAPQQSKVLQTSQRTISNHPWVDSLHLGSEVGAYYTRYMGTVKDKIAILVTFSAHKDKYTKYSGDFMRAIESLKVVATKDLLAGRPVVNTGTGRELLGPSNTGMIPAMEPPPKEDSTGRKGPLKQLIGLGLIVTALGLFIYSRTRRKRR